MPRPIVLFRLILAASLVSALPAAGQEARARVLVLTDISNEPDDEQSLVRFLVYANEFEIEGLVATTSTWLRQSPREDLIRRQLAAYAEVQPNLALHAPGYPPAEQLAAATHTGQPGYGMEFVGAGKSTAGSKHLLTALDRPDPRPLWVLAWGGTNTLAQALHDLRTTRTAAEVESAAARLRVYAIADQDDAGPWLRREFPGLFYVVSASTQDEKEYWRGTWTGISGDRFYRNGPMHRFDLVDDPWLENHIRRDHGPLGRLYPKVAYIMEGDTPSFLGLIRNGLDSAHTPAWGGWGGRYVLYRATGETRPIWTNNATSRDTVTINGQSVTSDPATVWRWREHFQHDFAARMDWCVANTFAQANHNPRPAVNGDLTRDTPTLVARPGSEIELSAAGTVDPDGHAVRLTWWIYPEAGTLDGATLTTSEGPTTTVRLPAAGRNGTVHVILQAEDDGAPHLFAYRRIVIEVKTDE